MTTLLLCPFCGEKPDIIAEKKDLAHTLRIRCSKHNGIAVSVFFSSYSKREAERMARKLWHIFVTGTMLDGTELEIFVKGKEKAVNYLGGYPVMLSIRETLQRPLMEITAARALPDAIADDA